MLADSAPETESLLAARLAATLADNSLWAMYEDGAGDENARDFMAWKALELYGLTTPIIEARNDEPVRPLDRGVAMLREIADGCAMLSHDWTEERREQLGIPSRALIEAGIRSSGVDEWAEANGATLDLREIRGVDEEQLAAQAIVGAPLNESYLVSEFAGLARSYEALLEGRRSSAGRVGLNSHKAREGACALIGLGRGWLIWVRGRLDSEAEAVAVLLLFMAQGFFVATREQTAASPLFPSKQFARQVLHSAGGYEWLAMRDADLPNWLT